MNPTQSPTHRLKTYSPLLKQYSSHPNAPPQLKDCLELLKTDYNQKTNDIQNLALRLQSYHSYNFGKEAFDLGMNIFELMKNTEKNLDYELAIVVFNVLNNVDKRIGLEFGLNVLRKTRVNIECVKLEEKLCSLISCAGLESFLGQFHFF